MQHCNDYIRQRLEANGYETLNRFTTADLFIAAPSGEKIWAMYLDKAIEPEQIRRCFDFPGHVLFVVNEKLIPQEIESRKATPMWLRVLHGLYMGRVYVWNNRHLFGLHFDYDTGDVSESGIIQPDELLLTESGTWLRGWAGTYKVARFYDRQWWNGDDYYERAKQQQSSENFKQNYYNTWNTNDSGYAGGRDNYYAKSDHAKQSNARADYEQARDHYWEQQRKREQSGRYGYGEYNTPPPAPEPSKPDFMREFARAGSPSAVKALYRTLAKKYHPDLNPGVDTTLEMQAVNAAYEVYK